MDLSPALAGMRRSILIPISVFGVQASILFFDHVASNRANPFVFLGLILSLGAAFYGFGSFWSRRFVTLEYAAFGALLGTANAGFALYLFFLAGSKYRTTEGLTPRGRDFMSITAAFAGIAVFVFLHGAFCRHRARSRRDE